MSGKTIKAKHEKRDSVRDWFERVLELVRDDKELHDTTVRMIDSYTNLQNAQAERIKQKMQQEFHD